MEYDQELAVTQALYLLGYVECAYVILLLGFFIYMECVMFKKQLGRFLQTPFNYVYIVMAVTLALYCATSTHAEKKTRNEYEEQVKRVRAAFAGSAIAFSSICYVTILKMRSQAIVALCSNTFQWVSSSSYWLEVVAQLGIAITAPFVFSIDPSANWEIAFKISVIIAGMFIFTVDTMYTYVFVNYIRSVRQANNFRSPNQAQFTIIAQYGLLTTTASYLAATCAGISGYVDSTTLTFTVSSFGIGFFSMFLQTSVVAMKLALNKKERQRVEKSDHGQSDPVSGLSTTYFNQLADKIDGSQEQKQADSLL